MITEEQAWEKFRSIGYIDTKFRVGKDTVEVAMTQMDNHHEILVSVTINDITNTCLSDIPGDYFSKAWPVFDLWQHLGLGVKSEQKQQRALATRL